MHALIVDHDAPSQVSLGEVPDPTPHAGEVLVEVERFSAIARNFLHAAQMPTGSIPGYDAAGTIIRAATDGSGPAVGTRIVALGLSGAWAQLRAVPVAELAALPDGIDPGLACVLAVPGVSALRALRRLGSLLGSRVLITGATGAVGHFAIQLAQIAGAHVIASARTLDRAAELRGLGADEVVTDLADVAAPVHGVIDNIGGPLLAKAFDLLAEGGAIEAVGSSSGQPAVLAPYQMIGPYRRIEGFYAGDRFGNDLAYLLDLAATGRLALLDGERAGWGDFDAVARRLTTATRPARAIVTIDHTPDI